MIDCGCDTGRIHLGNQECDDCIFRSSDGNLCIDLLDKRQFCDYANLAECRLNLF